MRRRLALLVLFLTMLVASPRPAWAEEPAPSSERVVLRTVAGDLVLVLYPGVAPRTVEQFLKLVRAGVYDTTAFVRVEPGFVVQVSAHHDRTRPLNDDQKALIKKLPGEFGSVPHVRGVLSMAREDKDPDSAETSFSILLGPAPHLDGKYTVFGRIEGGDAVLEEMLRVPRGPMMRPVARIEILRAEVVQASALPTTVLAPARAVPVPADALAGVASTVAVAATRTGDGAGSAGDTSLPLAGGIAFMCAVALAAFLLQDRLPRGAQGSLSLVVVLVGAFLLVVILIPRGHREPWLATVLFVGLVGLFRLLGRFERPSS